TIDQSPVNSGNNNDVSFTFAGAETGASYNYTFSSSGGGTPATSSGTVASATETVSGIDLSSLAEGTLTLTVTLTDPAGNAGLAATDTESYDATAPTTSSFERQTPASSPTNANSLVFRATFSEAVTAIDAADFAVNGTTTATVTSVSPVSSSVYDVTVSGGDLAGFEGTVGIDLSGSQNITDASGNALPGSEPSTDETYTVDNTAPSGYSVTIDQSPVNSGNDNAVSFTFAGAETGATYNYSFSSSGGGTSVTSSGTVASATETISGIDVSGLSDGTLTLNVTLTDPAGNAGSAASDTESYDSSVPGITSFTRKTPSSSPTNANSLVFLATFDEDVTAVDAGDFAINGTTTATVTSVAQLTASTYDITVSGGDLASFDGSVGLNLSGSQNITDLASNALPSGEPSTDEAYTLDNTAPSGYSITIDQSPINAGNETAVSFTFAGAETGATYNYSFSSSGGGTPVTSSGTVASATETISGIDVSGLTDGTLTLSVTLTDPAGNAGSAATDTESYDASAPTVSSFARQSPAANPTNAGSLTFRATFSEAVTAIDAADFAVNGTTTAGVTAVSPISSSVYDITVSGGDLAGFNGNVGIDLSGSQNITDSEGNALTGGEPATDETYMVDNTAPSGYSVTIDQSPVNADNENAVSFTFAGAEVGATYNYSIISSGGGTPAAASGTISSATQSISGIDVSNLPDGTLTLSVTLTDPAGNAGSAATDTETKDTETPSGYSVTIDQSPVNGSNYTAASFTFSGAEVSATYNYTFSTSGGSGTQTGSGTVSSATQTISGIDLTPVQDGTITLTVTLTDTNGNSGTAVTDTETKDTQAPSSYSVTIDQTPVNLSNEGNVSFTFAGAETGATYNYTVSSSGGGTPVSSTGTVASAT
ncbi:MAG: hypothetical protein MI784_08120, partial [Cytophagales bacterium]|nr:hypothetical protein [Cytophagales bacterium]